MLLHDRTNTSSQLNSTVFVIQIDLYSKGLFLCCAGIVADNGAIYAASFFALTFAKINCKGNPVNTF